MALISSVDPRIADSKEYCECSFIYLSEALHIRCVFREFGEGLVPARTSEQDGRIQVYTHRPEPFLS